MRKEASEMVAAAVNMGNKVEFLLCTMDMCFPTSTKLLNDPNVWITDMATTVHLMLHSEGLVNLKEASVSDSVTMGNGADVGAKMIMQLPGTICDKYRNELKKYAV